jgi:DNA anti-recombination protein RmuC
MSSLSEQHIEDGTPGGSSGTTTDSQSGGTSQLDRAPANIDKIRDILFGANMRDYEARFLRLEAAVAKETGDVRESMRRRFETLEGHLNKEIESLHARVKAEREERAEVLSQHSRELKETADGLDWKIRDLEDRTTAAESAIRQDIMNQSHTLTEDLHVLKTEITTLLEKRFQDLNRGKTDRATLSMLLTEIAMRLNDELHLPVADN